LPSAKGHQNDIYEAQSGIASLAFYSKGKAEGPSFKKFPQLLQSYNNPANRTNPEEQNLTNPLLLVAKFAPTTSNAHSLPSPGLTPDLLMKILKYLHGCLRNCAVPLATNKTAPTPKSIR